MSTTTTRSAEATRRELSFGAIIHSEWIKLRSIRSTWWLLALMFVITVGIAVQMSASTSFAWLEGGMTQAGQQAAGVNAITSAADLNLLVACVLGVLVIVGEYSSGTIRTSFAAVPRRVPVLLAKALVLAGVMLVIGALALAVAVPLSVAILAGNGVDVRLDDVHYWRGAIGGTVYLTLAALIAFGIGAIFRSTVGGIAASIGLVLILPIALGLAAGSLADQAWLQNVARLLPFNLGRALYTHPGLEDFIALGAEAEPPPRGLWALEPWQGALGLAVWVAVVFAVAIVGVRRRDT